MAIAKLTSEQIAQLSSMAAEFIQQQRDKHLPPAKPLTDEQLRVFRDFFPPSVLKRTRFCSGRIEDPPFYPMVEQMGIKGLPRGAESAAITYVDVIVAQEEYTDRLRFHELVHVVQYEQLGVARFADAYVRGFLSGGGYYGIPLEKNAYELEGRFAAAPGRAFDVAAEVAKWEF